MTDNPPTLAEIVADILKWADKTQTYARDRRLARCAIELASALGGYVQAPAWIEDNERDFWGYRGTDTVSGAPLYADPVVVRCRTENQIRDEYGVFLRGPLSLLPRVAR